MPRDISDKQFRQKCEQYGFVSKGFLGYYKLPCGVEVSVLNAGPTNRDRLAFLLQEQEILSLRK